MLTCPVCASDIDIEAEEIDEGDSLVGLSRNSVTYSADRSLWSRLGNDSVLPSNAGDECGADLKVFGKARLELQPADEGDEDIVNEEEEYEEWR